MAVGVLASTAVNTFAARGESKTYSTYGQSTTYSNVGGNLIYTKYTFIYTSNDMTREIARVGEVTTSGPSYSSASVRSGHVICNPKRTLGVHKISGSEAIILQV